jgi:hypothetical protein
VERCVNRSQTQGICSSILIIELDMRATLSPAFTGTYQFKFCLFLDKVDKNLFSCSPFKEARCVRCLSSSAMWDNKWRKL